MSDSKTGYIALPTEAAPPAYTEAHGAPGPSPSPSGLRDVLDRTERILLQPSGMGQMQIGGARNAKSMQMGVSRLDGEERAPARANPSQLSWLAGRAGPTRSSHG